MREKYSPFAQRVAWLVGHKEIWRGKKNKIQALKAVILAMKVDGLIAPSSYYLDCRMKKEFHAAALLLNDKRWEEAR